jgi:hypothetical protein
MKGPNGWKISGHFSSVGEFHFHRFWASHLRHEQLLRKSPPTDERFQRMEDQLALFIRWRIFFSSFLGVVLDAMNNSSENPCQLMKGSNRWKISWHFLSDGESHVHPFRASPERHEQTPFKFETGICGHFIAQPPARRKCLGRSLPPAQPRSHRIE